MQLLGPLLIFLILVVVMIVVLARTEPPDEIATVESFCDAIKRNDTKTQSVLVQPGVINDDIVEAIVSMGKSHREIAQSYGSKIIRTWDDANASYSLVEIPNAKTQSALQFTCRKSAQQWTISSISQSVVHENTRK